MNLKKNLEKFIRGWVPVEAKIPKKWGKNTIGITVFVLSSFSLIIILLLNSSFIVLVGKSSILWNQTYEEVRASNLVETKDGRLAFLLLSQGSYQLVNTDEFGNILWNQTYKTSSGHLPSSLIEDTDGGFVLAGLTPYSDVDGYYCWSTKTDNEGNMVWNQTYHSEENQDVIVMIKTSDGGFAIGGQATPHKSVNYYGTNDFWLAKIDASGNMAWSKTYGGPGYESLGSLVETSDEGFALAGMTTSYGTYHDYWVVKTDGSGNILWNQTYEGEIHQGYLQRIIETFDGGFALGSSIMQSDGNVDFWFAKTDSSGNLKWQNTYNQGEQEFLQSLVKTPDGGFIFAGTKYKFEPWNEMHNFLGDGLLIRIDGSGNMIWNQTFSGTGSNQNSNYLIGTSDGGYVLLGHKLSSLGSADFPVNDVWIAKIEEDNITSEFVFPDFIIFIILVLVVTGALAFLIISRTKQRKDNLEE